MCTGVSRCEGAVPGADDPNDRQIRFSFSLDDHRIEAAGQMAWSDVTRKRGGLKFTSISPDDRRVLSDWIGQHELPPSAKEEMARSRRSSREPAFLAVKQRSDVESPRNDAEVEEHTLIVRLPRPLTGFSGGSVAGVLISGVIAGLFTLQNHRRDFGATLRILTEIRFSGMGRALVFGSGNIRSVAQAQNWYTIHEERCFR